METAIIWVSIGALVGLYILQLQIQLWWRDRLLEYTTRPPRSEASGCGGTLVLLAFLLGLIFILSTVGH